MILLTIKFTMSKDIEYPNNIAAIRRMRGFSQAYIAEKIGVSRPKYIEIERGTKELTVSQLEKLKSVLSADVADLIGVDTGRFDFRKFLKKPTPSEKLLELGVSLIWSEEEKEWLVPATEVEKLINN